MIITSRKVKAQYEHLLRVAAARRNDVAMATDILYRTKWWRWSDRRQRRYARVILRRAIRGGYAYWTERDPFVWPPPGDPVYNANPSPFKDLVADLDLAPRSSFWRSYRSESGDDVVQ